MYYNAKLTLILTAIEAAGGTTPEPLKQLATDAAQLQGRAREFQSSQIPDLAAAWAEATLDGRDITEDPAIIRALFLHAIGDGDLAYAAQNVVERRAITALTAIQDDILATLKAGFDQAGATLTRAYGILGNTRLDDTTTVFGLGPIAVQAHQDAVKARRTTRTIDQGWYALAELTRFADPGTEHVTRWADLPLTTFEQHRRSKDVWDLVAAGHTLDLAIDTHTVQERQQRLTTERAEREARPERDARKARPNYLAGASLT